MFNSRVKKLIREFMTADYDNRPYSESEPDWNNLLIEHLNNSRIKREKRKKWTRFTAMATVVIVLTFASLIVLTSIDEITAGNFNLIEAIRNLGKGVEINEIQEKMDYSTTIEKTIKTYNTYAEMLEENPIIDYFKADYIEPGFNIKSIELTREVQGNTFYILYYNTEINDMFAIRGYFQNNDVDQSHVWAYPNSEHKVVTIDNIVVDIFISSTTNHAEFKINGVSFIIEYHELSDRFIENTIRNIKVYGRK